MLAFDIIGDIEGYNYGVRFSVNYDVVACRLRVLELVV